MSKLAVIDMGTNTFHLLVVEVLGDAYKIIHKEKIPVLLGKGGITNQKISADAKQRGLQALSYFAVIINENKVGVTMAVATSAVRSAVNGKEWLQEVMEKTGIEVNLIDGDTEAFLIWKGVSQSMDIPNRSLVMDIGGGSTEFIIGDNQLIFWKQSFKLGVSRLLDAFKPSDPLSLADIEQFQEHFRKELEPLRNALIEFPCTHLIGSSGSFDSLLEIMQAEGIINSNESVFSQELPINDYLRISKKLVSLKEAKRLKIEGLIPLRAKMIHVSCLLIDHIWGSHEFKTMHQSDYALKEGLIQTAIEKQIPLA